MKIFESLKIFDQWEKIWEFFWDFLNSMKYSLVVSL